MPSDKQYSERKAAGLCPMCGAAPPEPGKASCVPCRDKRRLRQNESYRIENGERARHRRQSRKKTAARIEDLNRKGWSDREVARRLGCSANRVRTWRIKLGLPSNAHNERHNQKAWAERRKKLKKDGADTLSEFILLSRRIKAASNGWPADLGAGEVNILNLLDKVGPKSKNEIMNLMGLKHLRSSGGGHPRSYLRSLIEGGLIEVTKKIASYGTVRLYGISPKFKETRAARQRSNMGMLSVPVATEEAECAME